MEKEIIGYKAPFDMFNKKVKKGTIYLIDENNSNAEFNSCSWTASCGMAYTNLPKEIVETWEPVYKEEELKVGDWVKWSGATPVIAKIHKYNNDNCYTLDVNGNLLSHNSCNKMHLRKVTPEEIEKTKQEALLEEARNRYPIGTKFKSPNLDSYIGTVEDHNKLFVNAYGNIDNNSKGYLYHSSKWAEIVPSYPQITINGHKGEFFDNYVRFGCAKISKILFTELNNSCTLSDIHDYGNKEITTVTIGNGAFTKEQIEEIAKYYNGNQKNK